VPEGVSLAYETVAGRRLAHRCALRRVRAAIDPNPRIAAPSHKARTVGGDGLGRATETIVSATSPG
jgi:hypothetical protein